MTANRVFNAFLAWRRKHISRRNFVFLLSIIIGIAGGLAAVTLKTVVHAIADWLLSEHSFSLLNTLYFLFPLIGILLTVTFIVYVNRNKLGHGVSNILYAISRKASFMEPDKTYSHMISSALTVGFGGSAGLEAPIVTTGSAIGSNLARIFRLDYKRRTLLIGCGAAAATAAIFNSPITGVIFALEVLLLELSVPAFIPLVLSSITATIVSKLLLGEQVLFAFNLTEADMYHFRHTHLYILLGAICGLFAIYFTRTTNAIENWFNRFGKRYRRALLGGVMLGALIFLFPPLYGEGYNSLKRLLTESPEHVFQNALFGEFALEYEYIFLFAVIGLIFVKVPAMAFTTGGGGNGGIFAPSMFTGGFIGFFMARLLNIFVPGMAVSEKTFSLVGMAGVMAGVMHAPLTAMFLILEITTSYELIIPLMLVSAIGYATIKYFQPHSIFAAQLARRGQLIGHNKDKAVLTLLELDKVIERDLLTIEPDKTLGDLVQVVAKSHRNIFPVVNEDGILEGIITLDDIREVMFRQEQHDTIHVKQLMHPPPAYVEHDEHMEKVMEKFDKTGAWNLPVIEKGKYVGFLSKSKIFNLYRELLIEQSAEE